MTKDDSSDVKRREIAVIVSKGLLESRAIKFGDFTLRSGRKSRYYIDLRLAPAIPDFFSVLIRAYVSIIKELGIRQAEAICGIPTAGLTYASVVAYELGLPLVYVRRNTKEYGIGRVLEGQINPGARVILLDDVITSGNSIISAANQIRAEGGQVTNCVVLIDRKEGGAENLKANQIELRSLSSIQEVAEILYDNQMISSADRESIHRKNQ